jgi:hypothetical protein
VDSEKLNNWLQLIGMAGVIGSLLFVGLQLKQTQNIAVSDTYQTRAYGSVESNMAKINSPILLSAEAKLWVGKLNDLEPEEIVALSHAFYGEMDIYENNHYQFNSGFLDEEHWQKNLAQLRCIFSQPIYQEFWVPKDYRKSFAVLIDGIVQDAKKAPSDCWKYDQGSIWDWE